MKRTLMTLRHLSPKKYKPSIAAEESLVKNLLSYYDSDYGGFGPGQKFPPHSTLLYLLYFLCVENNSDVQTVCRKTLDAMRLRGLNDHLQGGIFRYCVDRQWTIPHFEKMLYDQAMALWCYSLAYKVMEKTSIKKWRKVLSAASMRVLRKMDYSFRRMMRIRNMWKGRLMSGAMLNFKHSLDG